MNGTPGRKPSPQRVHSLWPLAIAPAIWAAHFLLSYVTAAVWWAKYAAPGDTLAPVRSAILIYTVLALLGIAAVGWRGWRQHRAAGLAPAQGGDTAADRTGFLGHATALLAGLSAVAVLFTYMAAVMGSTR